MLFPCLQGQARGADGRAMGEALDSCCSPSGRRDRQEGTACAGLQGGINHGQELEQGHRGEFNCVLLVIPEAGLWWRHPGGNEELVPGELWGDKLRVTSPGWHKVVTGRGQG